MLTESCEAGTPSCVEASPSSTCFADAAAARTPGPAFMIVLLAEWLPVFGVRAVSAITNLSWLMSMSSSSPAIISRPVSDPVPCLMPPVMIVAVLSAWIVIQESIWYWSIGVARVRVDPGCACLAGERRTSEAEADDQRAAALEERLARELLLMQEPVMVTCLPSPSRRRPA